MGRKVRINVSVDRYLMDKVRAQDSFKVSRVCEEALRKALLRVPYFNRKREALKNHLKFCCLCKKRYPLSHIKVVIASDGIIYDLFQLGEPMDKNKFDHLDSYCIPCFYNNNNNIGVNIDFQVRSSHCEVVRADKYLRTFKFDSFMM